MTKKKINILCFLSVCAMMMICNFKTASAQENLENFVIYDKETGDKEKIDLSSYNEVRDFISEPEIPEVSLSDSIAAPSAGIQSIIGNDDRQLVTNPTQYPYRTIARITVTYEDGMVAYGSGAMISSRLLATAGHLLINNNGSLPQSILMQFGRNGSSVYYETSNYSSYICREDYHGTNQPLEADYGFIVFADDTVNNHTGHLGIVTAPSASETLHTAGYPSDYGSYKMYETSGNILSMTDDLLNHNLDTMSGQSGSPVYVINTTSGLPYLVAIHSSGYPTYNVARRLEAGLFYWLQNHGYI